MSTLKHLAILSALTVTTAGCASKYCPGAQAFNPMCVNKAGKWAIAEERHEQGMVQAREMMRQQFDQQEATLERQRPYMTDDEYQRLRISLEDQRKAQEL